MSGGWLHKRGNIWYGRVRRKASTFEKSLETGSKTIARERLNRWIEELTAAEWGEKPRHTFDQAVKRFITEHFPTVRPSTATRYNISICHLIDHFQGVYLDEIGSERLYDFEMKRRKTVETPTVRRDLACLRTLFTCAETWNWVTKNPIKTYLRGRAKSLPENPPRNRVLTHQEEANLIASATEWSKHPRPDGRKPVPWDVIIPVAIDTGLRKEEMFSLERDTQLQLDRREIFIPNPKSKSGRGRSFPILDRSFVLLESLSARPGKPWVFHRKDGNRYSQKSPYVWESFKKIVAHAGIMDLTIHDLRRTCGCRLLQDRRMSMEEVSKWLGHSSITVTERVYAFLQVEHLHRAVERTRDNAVTLPPGDKRGDRVDGFSNQRFVRKRFLRE